jgi:glycosyltransferase involved in cell wall biosynthesis
MRILVVCDVLFPQTTGGAGRVGRELSVRFAQYGDEVEFLTRRTPKVPEHDGIRTTYFPPPGRGWPSAYRRLFRQTVERFRPDIIHAHQPLAAFLCIPPSCGRPIVYTYYSSWSTEILLKASPAPRWLRRAALPLFSGIEKRVVQRAQAVVVLSEFSRRAVGQHAPRRIRIIPGGVDSSRFRPLPREGREGVTCLISLRNLVPRMGLGELIKAVSLLPRHVELTIGGEGPLRKDLTGLIRELGLQNRVGLAGHVPDAELARFYSSADWFVLPTAALEGFGLVILESLSCGTPVLGTRVGAIPEVLSGFDPDWIIDRATPESIAAGIRSALEKPAPDPQALHRRVAAQYDWLRIAEQYRELFREVLGG